MTLDPAHFRERYGASPDPYGLADRWYEARKYALSVALLPRQRYGTAFEPGCSIGVLTERLASRCDRLLSCDAIPDAVAAARSRTAGRAGVRVEQRVVPGEWPTGSFDLMVFSEILYYFDDADLEQLLRLGLRALRPAGICSRCTGGTPLPITREPVTRFTRSWPGTAAARLAGYRDPDFTAEVYARSGGDLRSVAQAEGIV